MTERLGVVSADVAYGQHIGKDLLQGFRVIVGGRFAAFQKLIRESRETAIAELKAEAHKVGANAVIGVAFTVTNVEMGLSMTLVSVTGTAVVLGGGDYDR